MGLNPRGPSNQQVHQVYLADNLPVLRSLPGASVNLIYIDPPFNTGRTQRHSELRVERTAGEDGDRTGFKGVRYRTTAGPERSYGDQFDDFLGFLRPRLEQAY